MLGILNKLKTPSVQKTVKAALVVGSNGLIVGSVLRENSRQTATLLRTTDKVNANPTTAMNPHAKFSSSQQTGKVEATANASSPTQSEAPAPSSPSPKG